MSMQILPNYEYANALGERIYSGLLFWYSFTGCDTVSSFSGRGKFSDWDVWKTFPEVTDAFIALSNGLNAVTNEEMLLLQRYMVLLYDGSSHCLTVNDARRWLFTKKSRTAEGLPPTEDAFASAHTSICFSRRVSTKRPFFSPTFSLQLRYYFETENIVTFIPLFVMLVYCK